MIMKKVALMVSMLALFFACNTSDDLESKKLKVENGKVKSPQWLVERIDALDQASRNPADTNYWINAISVYSLKYKGQVYILFLDSLSSNISHCFFTIEGDYVNYGSSLYDNLMKVENKKSLWGFGGK